MWSIDRAPCTTLSDPDARSIRVACDLLRTGNRNRARIAMHEYDTAEPAQPAEPISVLDVVYLGFNLRVLALDRLTGEIAWEWKSPKGSGFVSLLLDADLLIASVNGYTYGLNPTTGEQLWFNPLKGYGFGTPCLASMRGNSGSAGAAAIIAQQHAAAAAAGS